MEIDLKKIDTFDFTKEVENARRTEITIIYEGKNITKEIHSQLTSCSQSDSINQLDTLELTLENRDMLWISSWMPQKGETLKASLTLKHWEKDLEIITHDMGLFYIDTVDFSGPPDIVNIKAISFDIASDIVDKKENKVWENVTFKTILNEIANKRKIKAICDISFNRKYKRIEQKLQSDFDFLKKLSEEAGINLKLFDNKIIAFEEEYRILKALRKEFSAEDIEIRVDANGAFTPAEAPEVLARLAELQLHSIEQPIKAGQWEAMAQLCRTSPLPIALDEELIGIFDSAQKKRLINEIQPQYIILKPSLIGGYRGSEEWIALAEAQQIGWWVTSALESNIGLNAIAQWTYTLHSTMPQGLGTGALYTNNLPFPLSVEGGQLRFNPSEPVAFPFS